MAEPRVSVLLPVRNAEATLATCLRSVARQRDPGFECVVVDDGSRDRSRSIAVGFARRDPRFRVVATPARGIVAALNEGLEHCRGRFVARMDADDWMHGRRLGEQADRLDANSGLAGVGTHVRMFPRGALRRGLRDYESWLLGITDPVAVRRERFIECPLPHPSWMLRREVYAHYGYRDTPWAEDYDLLLRTIGDGLEWGVIPQPLLAWREHRDRLWRSDRRYEVTSFQACKAHYLALGPLAARSAYLLWGYGETGKALRRALAAHGKHPAFIVELHPRRIGERIHGAPVVPPERLPGLPRLPLLISVAGATPRREIRETLDAFALEETRDYWCTA